ncbi:hypothetical protein GCM10009118_15860 [Wandonia haliotis]|uniref:Uncharacterized protein n=1 Tax=Wandonia haliotis TaxID=574963 RepID=A0ABP3Y350_9FLAO
MDGFISLYKILTGVSAAALLMGLILLFRSFKDLENSKKHLYILAIVNLISMLAFLFRVKAGYNTQWHEVVVLFDSSILVFNLIMGYFVYSALRTKQSFYKQIQYLFLSSFLAICILSFIYFLSGSTGQLLDNKSSSFLYVYPFTLILYLFGSLYPGIMAIFRINNSSKENKNILVLLILNGLNNSIGLLLFSNKLPTPKIAIALNIIFNLVFAYYMAYYFLSVYFVSSKKNEQNKEKNFSETFSWNELKKHLTYWGEVKIYLMNYFPELIQEVDALELTELEKIHLTLKRLNIKAKDIASTMNVSVKAIEMNRYRIRKKLNSET